MIMIIFIESRTVNALEKIDLYESKLKYWKHNVRLFT